MGGVVLETQRWDLKTQKWGVDTLRTKKIRPRADKKMQIFFDSRFFGVNSDH
jgi:hypothetical protein